MTPISKVFQQASPAVVNISTTSIVTLRDPFSFGGRFDDLFEFPMSRQPRQYESHSVGSGFLIHSDGYVVTNAHVVARTSERRIIFADGRELLADIVALDEANDIAILKVESDKPLPALTLGRSDDLMPGETVIAIGNPLGYHNTVTSGIVSALEREVRFSEQIVYKSLIQVDAAINPGNSGGPLLNVLGDLIGINTAIRGDAQNIGFAIPVDRLHELLPQILDVERARRVKLGIRFGEAQSVGGRLGVRVSAVEAGSPADKSGVKVGDVLTALDGKPTPSYIHVFSVLNKAKPNADIRLDVTRGKDREKTLDVMFAEVPLPDGGKLMWQLFGIRVRDLNATELRQLGLRRSIGLLVTEIKSGSQADKEGISPGDLLTSIGGWQVRAMDVAGNLLEQVHAGDRIPMSMIRLNREVSFRFEKVLRAS